ncbi:S8 family serine peptidase [candidate division WOR-3 bacterium]|uniref:S8 family serine peptidase n=1 Tax=candidate division WOR-3 bacterium TaxID=2052148 RepID=A0A9D5KB01_UNCW3|nr:S8 family serine peptidase [candidate division WOR-3 bacterium]MBD3365558.1 S8 family serine peptidase [candidate division WOR-3 bacterium]
MENSKFVFLILVLLPLMAAAAIVPPDKDLTDPAQFKQDHVAVKFTKHVDADVLSSLAADLDATVVRSLEQINAVEIKLSPDMSVPDAVTCLEALPDVSYACPVAACHVFWTPNDPRFADQWSFDADHLDMVTAWNINKGSSQIIVAIVDSGIAYEDREIPDYEKNEVISTDGNYHMCPDFTSSQFVSGYDFVHEDNHPNDQNGHGTHVGGTVAQATNNGIGVAGMAPECRLMPVQVMDWGGSGDDAIIADGILWAADNGAHVINLSLGTFIPGTPAPLEHEAIKYAVAKDIVVVAAAGNFFGWPEVSYPAAYEECIAVGATDYNDVRASYSQYGEALDISAPGGDESADLNEDGNPDGIVQPTFTQTGQFWPQEVKATVDEFSYRFLNGTSMATPHVSGLAALLRSHGIRGVDETKNIIYSTARDLGDEGYDTEYGHGMIDPVAALQGSGIAESPEGDILTLRTEVVSGSAEISFSLLSDEHVSLTVWDVSGRLIRTAYDGHKNRGPHTIIWDGTDNDGRSVSEGVYFARLRAGQGSASGKIVVAR